MAARPPNRQQEGGKEKINLPFGCNAPHGNIDGFNPDTAEVMDQEHMGLQASRRKVPRENRVVPRQSGMIAGEMRRARRAR